MSAFSASSIKNKIINNTVVPLVPLDPAFLVHPLVHPNPETEVEQNNNCIMENNGYKQLSFKSTTKKLFILYNFL